MSLLEYRLPDSRPDRQMTLTERRLLQSVVEIARHVFKAAASSVFLVDGETGELVFEAVAGEGEGTLPGARFPAGTGIAGWVVASAEPMLVDDLDSSDVFARAAAEATGYVPSSMMAAPLLRRHESIGVLEVLDPRDRSRGGLTDLDLLGLLAAQAAIGLDLLVRARTNRAERAAAGGLDAVLDRIGAAAVTADPAIVAGVTKMLLAADDLLARETG